MGMHDQLRRRSVGAPAARSLLLTMLGEYVLPRGEAVWQETLVSALASLGYTHQAARQALARSVRGGWLQTERKGRRARVRLSPATSELLQSGARRIYSFGESWEWNGRWLVLAVRQDVEVMASNVAGTAFQNDQTWIRLIYRYDVVAVHPEAFFVHTSAA